jgi:hypothetical protein
MTFVIPVVVVVLGGLLATWPLERWLRHRQVREELPPARRRVMSTVCCGVCRQTVPVNQTRWTVQYGPTCKTHQVAEPFRVAA